MNSIIRNQEGSICSIFDKNDDLLFKGKISSIYNNKIKIKLENDIKINLLGEKLKIFSKTRYGEDVVFCSTVFDINFNEIILQNIEIASKEKRFFFRIGVNLKADLIKVISESEIDNIDIEESIIEIFIENLSLGGALFSTEMEVLENTDASISVKIYNNFLMLSIVVLKKVKTENGRNFYACEFTYLDDNEIRILETFIFEKDRENNFNKK